MGKKKKTRDLSKERFWRKAIRKRERSGKTIREFCKRERLTEASYHFWRRELHRRDDEAVHRIEQQNAHDRPTNSPVDEDVSAVLIVVRDRCICVRKGFDPQTLRNVLEIVEDL